LVSAVGDIDIKVLNFANEGVALESITHYSRYKNPSDSESGSVFIGLVSPGGALYEYNKYNARYLHSYVDENGNYYYKRLNEITDVLNPDFDLSRNVPVPAKILSYGVWESHQTATQTGVGAQAVVQSSGKVTINASESFNNSVIKVNAPVGLGADRTGSTVGQGTGATFLFHLNSQLPPDLAQKQVNPLSLPGFSIPQGENGLFRLSGAGGAQGQTVDSAEIASGSGRQPGAHRYLIETNPELTNLKSFMGSDYLLGLLGYDLDKVSRRLGDGLFEQRLMREAIVARTGQRFLAGLTSDEAMFKYLMDNAVASKQALNLSLGVSLTAEQVAALTHDIVWLEEHEVMGKKVLVPVLYLAQAEGRLATNGALIQGKDVSLIGGAELINQGTLRASDNLSVTGRNIVNAGGLMEAGKRLDLLATDSIRNAQGGIIAGRDVSAIALTGDVINERTITTYRDRTTNLGYGQWSRDFADNTARIEAGNSLSISAGRDIANIGGALISGGDIELDAGRDVIMTAAEKRFDFNSGRDYVISQTNQLESEVSAGRDVMINAERDIAVIASDVEAKRDMALSAGRDVIVASAANEDHFYSEGDEETRQEDHVHQQSSNLKAGGDLFIGADRDLTFVASNAEAGGEAYLVAGEKLSMLSAEDQDYSLYHMEKDGSWGSSKTQHDEVTDIRHVGSSIKASGDITLISGDDQLYQAARLESGGDLVLDSGGSITFEAVKDLHQENHSESDSDWAWTSSSGEGKTDETLRQSVLLAKGDVVLRAADGINIDIKHVNKQTVSQTIDAMVAADPELAWLKEAEQRGDVDWRRVKEIHDSFKYSNSGLGAGAQLILAIVMAAIMGPAGFGLTGAQAAVAATVATTATNSAISNKGNLSAVLKDVTSSSALKSYVASGLTAGIGSSMGYDPTQLGFNWSSVGQVATKTAVDAGIKTAVYGGSLKNNLADAAVGNATYIISAIAFKEVGDFASEKQATAELAGDKATAALWAEGGAARVAMHAAIGGMLSSAMGEDFTTGAVAAGANQALAQVLDNAIGQDGEFRAGMSQIVGILAASLAGKDAETASYIAQQADRFNRQMHPEERGLIEQQAKALAKEKGISDEDATRLLASAFAYYTDADWNKKIGASGVIFDEVTLKHLGAALAPLGERYDVVAGDVPTVGGKNYSASETLRLLQSYQLNHEDFYKPLVNAEYLDDSLSNWQHLDFYNKYLNFSVFKPGAELAGAAQGTSSAVVDSVNGTFQLGANLFKDFSGTSSGIVSGLMQMTHDPVGMLTAYADAKSQAEVQAYLYRLQGNPEAAARVEANWDTQFALSFVAANRAAKLGRLGEAVEEQGQRVAAENGPKESAGGASSVQQISGGNIRHINGALGEAHGWKNALDSGHVPVKAPGKVTAPGVDFVTFDPKSGRVVLWDSKYRGPGGSYPSSIPESKLKSWTAEARAAVVQMPEGAMKNRILESLDKGKVDAKIFRWPQ